MCETIVTNPLTIVDGFPGRAPDVPSASAADVGEPFLVGDGITTANGRVDVGVQTRVRRTTGGGRAAMNVTGSAAASGELNKVTVTLRDRLAVVDVEKEKRNESALGQR
jgi:hypothetical protein